MPAEKDELSDDPEQLKERIIELQEELASQREAAMRVITKLQTEREETAEQIESTTEKMETHTERMRERREEFAEEWGLGEHGADEN
jgi:predicted  nucleic acid-binding Zn-ribbon protein